MCSHWMGLLIIAHYYKFILMGIKYCKNYVAIFSEHCLVVWWPFSKMTAQKSYIFHKLVSISSRIMTLESNPTYFYYYYYNVTSFIQHFIIYLGSRNKIIKPILGCLRSLIYLTSTSNGNLIMCHRPPQCKLVFVHCKFWWISYEILYLYDCIIKKN